MLRISYTLTEATSTKSVVGEHRLDKGIATGRGLPGPDTRALSEVGSLTYWRNAGPAITLAPREVEAAVACSLLYTLEKTL